MEEKISGLTEIQDVTILFVDDEQNILNSLERSLFKEPYRKIFAQSVSQAKSILASQPVHIVVSDMNMPETNGLQFLKEVKEKYPHAVRMILSGISEFRTIIEAINTDEIYRYISKPINEPKELKIILRQAIEYFTLRDQSRILMEKLRENNSELKSWKDRISEELALAGSLQKKIFRPNPFFSRECEIKCLHRPLMDVGGDIFGIESLKNGRICIYIGDVSGHGVGAALVSFLMKAIIKESVDGYAEHGPARICNEISARYLDSVSSDFFVTLFIGIFNPSDYSWKCMNCGHPFPILIPPDGDLSAASLPRSGGDIPIGMGFFRKKPYSEEDEICFRTPPGFSVIFYTDGIVEAVNKNTGQMCGEDTLFRFAKEKLSLENIPNPASEIVASLEYQGFGFENDDITVITARFSDAMTLSLEKTIPADLESVSCFTDELEKFLLRAGWADEAAYAARLICVEHLTNIVKHGFLPASSEISFMMKMADESTSIVVSDSGCEWCFAEVKGEEAKVPAENGYGLMIIRNICRHFEFYRKDNRNYAYFVLSKNFSLPPNNEQGG